MAVAEISAGLTSLRAALDITKAMIGLRDAEAFRTKSLELQGVIAEALGQVIDAREAHAAQIDRVRALEAEVAELKTWDAEKQTYELKTIGHGSVAYMLKPEARGTSPAHWLCPSCYSKGKKSFLQATGAEFQRKTVYKCSGCDSPTAVTGAPKWD